MGRRLTSYERRERERQREGRAAVRREKTAARRAEEREVRERQRSAQKNLKDREKAEQIKVWEKEVDKYNNFIESFSNLHNSPQINSDFSFETFARRMHFQSNTTPPNKREPVKKDIKLAKIQPPPLFSYKPNPKVDELRKKSNYDFGEYCKETGASSFFLLVLILGTKRKYDEFIANSKQELSVLEKTESKREEEEKASDQKSMEKYEEEQNASKAEYEKAVKLAEEEYQKAVKESEEEYQKAVNAHKSFIAREKDDFDKAEEKRLQFVKDLLSGNKDQIGVACELVFPIVFNLDEDWLNSDPDDHMMGCRVVNSKNAEIVISLPQDINFLPQKGIKMSSTGQSQSEYKISDRDRFRITDDFISSLAFAYTRVVYKIAPTINTVVVEVSKLGTDPATGNDRDYNYLSIKFDRDTFSSLNLSKIAPVDALYNFDYKVQSIKNTKKNITLNINRDSLEWATEDDSNIKVDKHLQAIFVSSYNREQDVITRLKKGESVDMSFEKPSVHKSPNADAMEDVILPTEPLPLSNSPSLEKSKLKEASIEKNENVKITEDSTHSSTDKTNTKKIPIWKTIQESFKAIGKDALEKTELTEYILNRNPEIKRNTLHCQITIQTVNNRSRTNFPVCKKPRLCDGEYYYDWLFMNEDKTLTRFDKRKHGTWEILEKENGKFDVSKIKSDTPVRPTETTDDPVESFRNFMFSNLDKIKLPNNKPYGLCQLGNGFEIGFHARRDHLSINFRSSGKVDATDVLDWINKKGLTGKTLMDEYICQPLPGKRNPNVVTVELHIPYGSNDELNNNDLREKAVDLFRILKEEFSDISHSF